MHEQLVVDPAHDCDRVWDLWVIVVRAPDDELVFVQPLERGPAGDVISWQRQLGVLIVPVPD